MPAVESRAERILASVRTQLASIVAGTVNPLGYTYWLTPKAVLRVDVSSMSEKLLTSKPTYDTIYLIVTDIIPRQPNTSFRVSRKTLRFELDLLTKYRPLDSQGDLEDPFKNQDNLRDTLRGRMAADVEAKLYEWTSLGDVYPGLEVDSVDIEEQDHSPEATNIPGWARVILRVAVQYSSRPEAP